MQIFRVRNVNEAYLSASQFVHADDDCGNVETCKRPSRYGDVIEFVEPVATVYERPAERVLFDPGRNANPFFHFMEAIWMLAGRRDVAFVERYNSKMREFSDDGKTFHGAYGHRWRGHFEDSDGKGPNGRDRPYSLDQLESICEMLKKNPDDRRAVLAMWDPAADLGREGKDFPCNTHVYFKVRRGLLLTTVLCRSNDMVWGAYGANAVHFSVLAEYIAARVGVPLGPMTQVSDSLHVYEKVWRELPMPADVPDPYSAGEVEPRPMFDAPDLAYRECALFCEGHVGALYRNWIFPEVAEPMRRSWDAWKAGDFLPAQDHALRIGAPDWRRACVEWLQRAAAKRAKKGAENV